MSNQLLLGMPNAKMADGYTSCDNKPRSISNHLGNIVVQQVYVGQLTNSCEKGEWPQWFFSWNWLITTDKIWHVFNIATSTLKLIQFEDKDYPDLNVTLPTICLKLSSLKDISLYFWRVEEVQFYQRIRTLLFIRIFNSYFNNSSIFGSSEFQVNAFAVEPL